MPGHKWNPWKSHLLKFLTALSSRAQFDPIPPLLRPATHVTLIITIRWDILLFWWKMFLLGQHGLKPTSPIPYTSAMPIGHYSRFYQLTQAHKWRKTLTHLATHLLICRNETDKQAPGNFVNHICSKAQWRSWDHEKPHLLKNKPKHSSFAKKGSITMVEEQRLVNV